MRLFLPAASQDSPGPMARTVVDVALLYEVLAGTDGVVARVAAGADGVRIGAATTLLTNHPGTDALFAAAEHYLRLEGFSGDQVLETKLLEQSE